MDANAFRYVYAYHFAENRKIWESYILPLSCEQFTHSMDYSHGSVRDQIIHLMTVDDVWFSELQGIVPSEYMPLLNGDDRDAIRAYWDQVEQRMRAYLGGLRDDMLLDKPIHEPEEDKDLIVWQVLLHVINHGTDHRAQILRALHDLGVRTTSQDFIFHVYDHM